MNAISILMIERTMPNLNYEREKHPILDSRYLSECPDMPVSVPSSYSGGCNSGTETEVLRRILSSI
jgi:hypothetical protein